MRRGQTSRSLKSCNQTRAAVWISWVHAGHQRYIARAVGSIDRYSNSLDYALKTAKKICGPEAKVLTSEGRCVAAHGYFYISNRKTIKQRQGTAKRIGVAVAKGGGERRIFHADRERGIELRTGSVRHRLLPPRLSAIRAECGGRVSTAPSEGVARRRLC
jgi:hypothetical protein